MGAAVILDDYSAFVGVSPVVLVDTPEAIRCLHTTTEHLGKALRFLAAADTLALEVIFNVEASPLDGGVTAECLECVGGGCESCRWRGYMNLDGRTAVQVVADDLTVTMLFVTVGDDGAATLGAPTPVLTAEGPLLDALRSVRGIERRRGLLVEDLIQVAREEGWAEIWR